ncbi:MAG: response regulator [Magnetococcales bacterium]|nr:response regulator [Magnetococcales bacterium]
MSESMTKVALITDTPMINSIIKYAINPDEYEVVIFGSSDENLFEGIVKSDPDVIFLRTILKDSNGLELCDQIKAEPALKSTRVVFLSSDTKVRKQAIEHKADRFLTMPFSAHDVESILESLFVSRVTILYVDDSDLFHSVVPVYLRDAGYNVVEAWDGREALEVLDQNEVDLILSDVEMPVMDGFTFCKTVNRSSEKDIPIVLLTSLASEDAIKKGFDAGADDYITKPLFLPEVLSRIHRLLDMSQTQGRSERILVVEDSDTIRSMSVNALKAQGFQVDEANNGTVALVRLLERPYDILVTDYEMPHLDGLQLCKRIRKQQDSVNQYLPVIFATTRNSKADLVRMSSIGIEACITKPFSPERMIAEVERVLAKTRQEKERESMRRYNLSDEIIEQVLDPDADHTGIAEEQFRTVLFCDLSGFGNQTAGLEPSKVIKILNTFFDSTVGILGQFDATIDKIIGDSIFASFSQQDDGAHRAATAAQDIVGSLKALGDEVGFDYQVRIGLHSGFAILGHMGTQLHRREFGLIGEMVNIAQAMEAHAKVNGILVSEATFTLIQDLARGEDVGPVVWKPGHKAIRALHLNDVTPYQMPEKVDKKVAG